MLSLHLGLALSGDEFQTDIVLHPVREQAEVLPDVVWKIDG